MPDASVQCCVTSPPYFGLRNYGNDGQIGMEPTPDEFVAALVTVFREVRRVLADDGTLWLNLGDSYAGGAGNNKSGLQKLSERWDGREYKSEKWKYPDGDQHCKKKSAVGHGGLKQKDLIGIPWRVAFALQADGWYLRQDIIWAKPNPMPESVRDRCTKSHEYIFLLSKSPRYFYDNEAIKVPVKQDWGTRNRTDGKYHNEGTGLQPHSGLEKSYTKANKRSVWTVSTKPYKGAHFATFPPDLIEPCILAGTSELGHCPGCGARWAREMAKTSQIDATGKGSRFDHGKTGARDGGDRTQAGERFLSAAVGWKPSCSCDLDPDPDVVLDPFGGSGTTAGVALAHGRNAVLCELSQEYADLVPDRVESILTGYGKIKKPKPAKKPAATPQKELFHVPVG